MTDAMEIRKPANLMPDHRTVIACRSKSGNGREQMAELNLTGSKSEHERAIETYLLDVDPELGAILAPYLKFARLDELTDQDRRRLRAEITTAVRAVLDKGDGHS